VINGPEPLPTGQEFEAELLIAATTSTERGFGGMLVLGESGSGKTTLLHAAAAAARNRGTVVLEARGHAADRDVPLGCVSGLVAGLDHVPAHVARVLEARTTTGAVDTDAVAAALGSLLASSCATAPLVLVVDDAHQVDRPSVRVLHDVTTRLASSPLVLLLAAPSTVAHGWDAGLPVLRLRPLGAVAAARLADAQRGRPTGRARARVLRSAAGNPLAIVEMARAATHSPGPATARIRQMVTDGLALLPRATRRLLLYAAAAGDEHLRVIATAARSAPGPEPWEPARREGLVVVDDERVRFRHPLARAAFYWDSTALERQRAHLDLAASITDRPARAAWHRTMACVGTDEAVAAELERTAGPAAEGRYEVVHALHHAAQCTPDRDDRAKRYVKAMVAASGLGAPVWVRELHAEVVRCTSDRTTLREAACSASGALSLSGSQREAFVLASSVVDDSDGADRAAVLATLGQIAFRSGLPDHAAALRDRLARSPASSSDPEPFADADAAVTSVRADPSTAAAVLARFPTPEGAGRRDGPLLALGEIAWYADESDACVGLLRQAVRTSLSGDAPGTALAHAVHLACALIDTSRWAEASELLDEVEAHAATYEVVQSRMSAGALRVELRARLGRDERRAERAHTGWYSVDMDENRVNAVLLRRSTGLAAMAAGQAAKAYRHFRDLFDAEGTPVHPFLSHRSIADLATAAVRGGDRDDALRVLRASREHLGRGATTRVRLLLHHAEALIGDPEEAEGHFTAATTHPAAGQWPLEHATARLHHAEWLRRRRRTLEARSPLSTALDSFAALGVDHLARRAREELRAAGGAAEGGNDERLADLTAQQRRTVLLVARGLRNQDIADQLQVSTRTVAAHLRGAYSKLGISNRHQLGSLVEQR